MSERWCPLRGQKRKSLRASSTMPHALADSCNALHLLTPAPSCSLRSFCPLAASTCTCRVRMQSKQSAEEYHAASDRTLNALIDHLEALTEEHPGDQNEREAEYSVRRARLQGCGSRTGSVLRRWVRRRCEEG